MMEIFNCLIIAELIAISQRTTEFHFSPIDEQFEKIRDDVKEAVAYRKTHQKDENDPQLKKNTSKTLQTGDMFTTRHSNLNQVHVVFHLVVNDTLRSGKILIKKFLKL